MWSLNEEPFVIVSSGQNTTPNFISKQLSADRGKHDWCKFHQGPNDASFYFAPRVIYLDLSSLSKRLSRRNQLTKLAAWAEVAWFLWTNIIWKGIQQKMQLEVWSSSERDLTSANRYDAIMWMKQTICRETDKRFWYIGMPTHTTIKTYSLRAVLHMTLIQLFNCFEFAHCI